MKLRKAPGIGGIYPEFLKYGFEELFVSLTKLFEHCINGKKLTEEWKTAYITPFRSWE